MKTWRKIRLETLFEDSLGISSLFYLLYVVAKMKLHFLQLCGGGFGVSTHLTVTEFLFVYRMSTFRVDDLEDSDTEMDGSQVDMSLEKAKLVPATKSIIVR